jgi:hypothetical protein
MSAVDGTTKERDIRPLGVWSHFKHPIPDGTHVHHRGGRYSRVDPELGGHYWGRVIRSVKQGDGTYEYEVMPDGPFLSEEEVSPTWWASYHIDFLEETEKLRSGWLASQRGE